MQPPIDAVVDIHPLEELAGALQRLAAALDDLLLSDGPDQKIARTVRLLAAKTLRTVGSVIEELDARHWNESVEAGLQAMATEYAALTGAAPHVRVRGSADQLPKTVTEVLRQVAGEALRTIDRHSRASVLLLSLDIDEGSVTLDIVDDGIDLQRRPVAAWASSADVALRRMGAAVHALGGSLVVQSLKPRGLRLRAVVPPAPVSAQ